MKMFMHFN